jgi:hypothetical protein
LTQSFSVSNRAHHPGHELHLTRLSPVSPLPCVGQFDPSFWICRIKRPEIKRLQRITPCVLSGTRFSMVSPSAPLACSTTSAAISIVCRPIESTLPCCIGPNWSISPAISPSFARAPRTTTPGSRPRPLAFTVSSIALMPIIWPVVRMGSARKYTGLGMRSRRNGCAGGRRRDRGNREFGQRSKVCKVG